MWPVKSLPLVRTVFAPEEMLEEAEWELANADSPGKRTLERK